MRSEDSSLGLLAILCRWSGRVLSAETLADRCLAPIDAAPPDDVDTDDPIALLLAVEGRFAALPSAAFGLIGASTSIIVLDGRRSEPCDVTYDDDDVYGFLSKCGR